MLDETAVFNIVLVTVLGSHFLTVVASLLNYNALKTSMPLEFHDVYDGPAYQKSQEYTRAKTVFSLLNSTCASPFAPRTYPLEVIGASTRRFGVVVFLSFWIPFCGFEQLDVLVRSLVPSEHEDSWIQIQRSALSSRQTSGTSLRSHSSQHPAPVPPQWSAVRDDPDRGGGRARAAVVRILHLRARGEFRVPSWVADRSL